MNKRKLNAKGVKELTKWALTDTKPASLESNGASGYYIYDVIIEPSDRYRRLSDVSKAYTPSLTPNNWRLTK